MANDVLRKQPDRLVRLLTLIAVALAGLITASLVIGRTAPIEFEQAALAAHRAFLVALEKGDARTVSGMLDRHFVWVDAQGKTRARREALKQLGMLAAVSAGDAEVETHFYGRMLTVRGTHHDARFIRVFVKRRHAWKPILLMDTPIAPAGELASVERSAGEGDCDNPCRSLPYVAKTQTEKDIVSAWQQTKLAEWKPDPAQWSRFVADEFMIVNNTTIRNKEQRLDIARRAKDAGTGTPGDPVLGMHVLSFGTNAALMISQHAPYRGGKPYTNARVWVFRDGRWQLALSQQVTIQSEAPVAALQADKAQAPQASISGPRAP
jgi:hypothetical protein